MREFVSSNLGTDDGASLRARIATDGYFVVRGLLDPAAVSRAADDIAVVAAELGWIDADHRLGPSSEVASDAVNRREPGYFETYARLQAIESLHRLAFDRSLRALMNAVVGDDVYVHPCKCIRVVWPAPRGGRAIGPHQDFAEIQGTEDFFVSWTPLTPCPPERAGLAILAGSQNEGIVDVTRLSERDRWTAGTLSPGDVLVFHGLTVHQGLPNDTDKLRVSVDFRWQSTQELRIDDAAWPHFYPDIPWWDELTRDWSSTAWIDAPTTGVVTRGPREEVRARQSRFVTVPESAPA